MRPRTPTSARTTFAAPLRLRWMTRDAVDNVRTVARPNADTTDGATPVGEAGARSDPADRKGTEGSKEANGAAQSTLDKGLAPPGPWSASQKEMFKSLPEAAQRFLIERHQAMEADHHRKTQAVANIRRDHDAIGALFAPYREVMQARGITPRQVIEYWADTERRLGQGDGIAVIRGIAEGYNIDPTKIAAALGVTTQAGEQRNGERRAANAPQPQRQSPADVEAALAEIARIKERLAAEDRARAEAGRSAQEAGRLKRIADIEKFKSEADEHGNLLRPYAAEVEEDMLHLAYVAPDQGRGQGEGGCRKTRGIERDRRTWRRASPARSLLRPLAARGDPDAYGQRLSVRWVGIAYAGRSMFSTTG